MSKWFLQLLENDKVRLVQLSFLMLFLELALIRWTGSNIVHLFFFTNFILLASFLGIGLGFIRSSSRRNLFPLAPIIIALIILFVYHYRYEYQIKLDPVTDDLNLYGLYFKDNVLPVWVTLPLLFIAVTSAMVCVANGVASTFKKFPSLQAYRLEIIGSLLGIGAFSALSFVNASPIWWGSIITLLFTLLLKGEKHLNRFLAISALLALAVMMLVLAKEALNDNNRWSPYYKIGVKPYSHERYAINVNGLPQQFVESVEQRKKYKPFYFFPYEHHNKRDALDNVLVIGAGTGGDVAIALAQGAKHVDAVEIDPELYHLGLKLNPNQPYHDARVTVHIDDGRAFLQQNKNLYDLIIFALPDSLTIISRQSSLRLENYLFTQEAITLVKQHLKPDGVFAMYNYYRLRWIVDRLANTLKTVFHHAPCVDTEGANNHWLTVLTISPSETALQCSTVWQPTQASSAKPITDNYPFLYMKEKQITPLYFVALLFILFVAHWGLKITGLSYRSISNYFDLFLMGAAFLLLETKSIINYALFFGSTWFVNALVFMGILLTVYLAIEVTNKITISRVRMLYIPLIISLALAWVVPNAYLLGLSFYPRLLLATVLTFLPIFIANLIFTHRFKQAGEPTQALGINIMGAVVGGLLEYISLMLGYQSLLLLIAILYTLAIFSMKPLRPLSV